MAVVYLTGLALSLPVRWGPVDRIDERLTTAVVGWVGRHRIVRETALVVTNLGAPVLLALVVAIGAGLLWRRGDLNGARTLLLCGVLGAVVETALKLTVARARPDLDSLVTARYQLSVRARDELDDRLGVDDVASRPTRAQRGQARSTGSFLESRPGDRRCCDPGGAGWQQPGGTWRPPSR